MAGFLGTHASFAADVNLLLQIAMGLALVAGALLARFKRYKAHGLCMATILLLNLPIIASLMGPSFRDLVLPVSRERLGRKAEAIATIHGSLGVLAELFGLYILIVAGTNKVPYRWRFRRWKLWMRVELGIWWIVLLAGVDLYFTWYGVPHIR